MVDIGVDKRTDIIVVMLTEVSPLLLLSLSRKKLPALRETPSGYFGDDRGKSSYSLWIIGELGSIIRAFYGATSRSSDAFRGIGSGRLGQLISAELF